MNDYTFDYSKSDTLEKLEVGDILAITRRPETPGNTRTIRRLYDMKDRVKLVDMIKSAFSYGFRVTKLK